jgi:N-acetylglucosaminyldiphosphoundecaprenol N-acetyl-beta-D-mannosaminyltransferase
MYVRHGDLAWDAVEASDAQAENIWDGSEQSRAAGRRNGKAANGEPVSRWQLRQRKQQQQQRPPVVDLSGVELHAVTEAGCIQYIMDELAAGRGGVVVTPNLDHLRRCRSDMAFGALVAEADLKVADGMPLVWASRLQGTPLPERVAGSDLISSLSAAAAEWGRSIFFLGGDEGTAETAAKILKLRHPELKVVGTYYPPFGFDKKDDEITKIESAIAQAAPDIVYVALGSPKQELLIERIRRVRPAAWWLGVGNSFSFLAGNVRRAPVWMQKRGLEWIHRLAQEPKKLFKRYIVFGVPFAASLLGKSAIRGLPDRVRARPASPGVPRPGTTGPVTKEIETPFGPPRPGQAVAFVPVDRDANPDAVVTTGAPAARVATNGTPRPASTLAVGSLSRLRALVLLGGTVRTTALSQSIGRSVLDLPLDEHSSLLTHWIGHADRLAAACRLEQLPIRVMVDRKSPDPISALPFNERIRVERDFAEYRGTGGVLRDIASDYQDDDLILVANAAQVLTEDLRTIAAAMEAKGGDVTLVSHTDGTPSGLMLIRCQTLRLIGKVGFVDMKEQALPLIAKHFDVRVLHRRRPTGLPVRSLDEYVGALKTFYRLRIGMRPLREPLAEDWRSAFSVVEDGAYVDPTARLFDSVVLRGARVEAGAVVLRSVVCPGGVVRKDGPAVDRFVTPEPEKQKRRQPRRQAEQPVLQAQEGR